MYRAIVPLLAIVCLISTTSTAFAQDADKDLVPDAVKKTEKKKEGWDTTLSVGATINMIDNRNVVGQNEGSTWTLGGMIKGDTKYKKGAFEMRSALTINENFTRSPVIPEFLNTADALNFDINGYYNLVEWAGLFVRAELNTNLFNNYFASATDVVFAIDRGDGNIETTEARDRLLLKSPVGLVVFKESIGAFVRPYSKPFLDAELRLGAGAREVLADGQIAISDDAATANIIEAKGLENYVQIGAEFGAVIKGSLAKDRVVYKSSLETLFPFYNSINPQDKGVLELTNVDWTSQISFKLVEWASLDYQLKVVRQPLILEKWQVQNSLLLTFGYTLIEEVEGK